MIEINSVNKLFGSVLALHDISFHVEKGDIVGLLGPNGAGKTTLMRILSCFFTPSSGRVRIAGLDIATDSLSIRRKLGYFPEEVNIYPEMRVAEFLDFVAKLKGIPKTSRKEKISDILDACGLGDVRYRIIGDLSKGYRRRVGLSQALLNNPEVLLLDEPTIGLDPGQLLETRTLIKELSGQQTVILSTHVLSEVTQICNKVIILNKGSIVAVDTPERLETRLTKGTNSMLVQIEASEGKVIEKLKEMPKVIGVQTERTISSNCCDYLIEADKDVDIPRELCALSFKNRWILREIRSVKMNMEEIFLELVAKEGVEQ